MLSGGAPRQVGGEFLFEGGKVAWCKRMRNTRDHAEISEIKQHLGLVAGGEGAEVPSAVAPTTTTSDGMTTTPAARKRASLSGLGGLGQRFNQRRQSWGGSRSRSRVTEKEKAGTPPPAGMDEVKEEGGNTTEDALAKLEGRGGGVVDVDKKVGGNGIREVNGMTNGMANGNAGVVA